MNKRYGWRALVQGAAMCAGLLLAWGSQSFARDSDAISVWVVENQNAGDMGQVTGVAQILDPDYKLIEIKRADGPGRKRGTFQDPVFPRGIPDVVINAGGHARRVSAAREAKARSGGTALLVNLPPCTSTDLERPEVFDLLVQRPGEAPLSRPNVMTPDLIPHRVTAEALARAVGERPDLAGLPRPIISALVGGNIGRRVFYEPTHAKKLGKQLASAQRVMGGTLLVTDSRRTPPASAAALKGRLDGLPNVRYFPHDGADNPYLAMLGASDFIVVTGDSLSMLSEALSTGKPVYIANPSFGEPPHRAMMERAIARGWARPLPKKLKGTPLEHWSYRAPNVARDVATRVRELVWARRAVRPALVH